MENPDQYLKNIAVKSGGLFVTATDTGVGKTFVSCLLARDWHAAGLKPGVFKPAECGGDDAKLLKKASGTTAALNLVNPYRWKLPLAPAMAAKIEGGHFSLVGALRAWKSIKADHGPVLVEGAGGLLVPLNSTVDVAQLALKLNLPLLIIARAGLGTLNHSLLTVEAARKRRLKVAAVLLNGHFGSGASVGRNGRELARLAKVRVIGPLRRGAKTLGGLEQYPPR